MFYINVAHCLVINLLESMTLNYKLLIIIFICLEFQKAISQNVWDQLDNEKTFYCEDIAVSPNGNFYIAIEGRKSILESQNFGINWVDICLNDNLGIRYYAENNSKKLFINHQDSLVELFYDNGFIVPRYFNGTEFNLDTLIYKFNAQVNDNLKFDQNGNYYYYEKEQLYKYINPYFDSYKVFNNGDKIVSAFMFDTLNNFIVTYKDNGIINVHKFNSKTLEYKTIISNFHEGANLSGTVIAESGIILISSLVGLYRYENDGVNCELVQFDPNVDPEVNIELLLKATNGSLLIRVNNLYYYSIDNGKSWLKLNKFNVNFPEGKIVKLLPYDSTNALLLVEQNCGFKIPYILKDFEAGWVKINDAYSALKLYNLYKTSNGTIYAKTDKSCTLISSDDESKTWVEPKIFGQSIHQLFELGDSVFYATTTAEFSLFKSTDYGKNWQKIYAADFGDPNLSFLGMKQVNSSRVYLIAGYKDTITNKFVKFVVFASIDSKNWVKLEDFTASLILRELVFDNFNNLIFSYQPWSDNQIYTSFDNGNTFTSDDRFQNFNKIYSLNCNERGEIFVCGELNGKLNLYIYKNLTNFIPYHTDQFKNKFITPIKKLRNNNLLAIMGIDGVFLSSDGGENWINYNKGLNLNGPEIYLVKDVFIDKQDNGYVCLEYDGLYKSTIPLVATENLEICSKVKLSPNPALDHITFYANGNCNFNNAHVFFYDKLGRVVYDLQNKVDCLNLTIPIDQLPTGSYIYKLINSKSMIYSGVFIKK